MSSLNPSTTKDLIWISTEVPSLEMIDASNAALAGVVNNSVLLSWHLSVGSYCILGMKVRMLSSKLMC